MFIYVGNRVIEVRVVFLEEELDLRGQTYVILALVFTIVIAIFAVINVDPVEVNYLFGSGEAPLILVILFSVLMGGIVTAAVGLMRMIHLQRERKSLLAENKKMTDTLESHQLLNEVNTNDKEDSSSEGKNADNQT